MARDSQAQATFFDLILEGSGKVVTFSNQTILPTSVIKSYPGTATGQQCSSWSTHRGVLEGYNLIQELADQTTPERGDSTCVGHLLLHTHSWKESSTNLVIAIRMSAGVKDLVKTLM